MTWAARRAFVSALALAGALSHAARAFELEAQLDGAVDEVAIELPPAGQATGPPPWHRDVVRPGANYIRLHIARVTVPEGTAATLVLRDASGTRVREYDAGELARRAPFWSAAVIGDHAQLVVEGEHVPPGFVVLVDRVAYQAEAGAPLSTYGEDRKEHVRVYAADPVIWQVQRSVAKLLFMKDGAPRVCTGFLVGDDALMTNHHCISTDIECRSTVALFGYQLTPEGRLDAGRQYECRAVDGGRVDYDLDFAVLELDGRPGEEWGVLALAGEDPPTAAAGDDEENHGLFIVQHPGGAPKLISWQGCGATAAPVDGRAAGSDFAHRCDTLGGSSGSPVVDLDGRVVGLHHYGFADGEGQAGAWGENRAVRMRSVLERISSAPDPCPFDH